MSPTNTECCLQA